MTTLNDLISNIDENFPVPNVDNPSQGFRDNFFNIKYALQNINENPYQLSMASAGGLGGVKVGYGLTMNSYTGVLSVSQIVATTSTLGFIAIGSGLATNSTTGVTSVTPGTTAIVGGVKSDNKTIAISSTGTITATGLFNGAISCGSIASTGNGVFSGDIRTNTGAVRGRDGIFSANIYASNMALTGEISAGLPLSAGTGYVVNFNPSTKQLVYRADNTLYTLPTATALIKGGVKIGSGVNVAVDGTISVDPVTPYVLPPATYSALGGIIVGPGFTIDSNGLLSFNNPGFDGGTISQPLLINNYTQSYSTLSGALIVEGGAGIAGTLWAGALSVYGNEFVNGQLFLQNTTQSTSTVSGALIVAGGVGISGNLHVAGEIIAQKLTIQLTTVTTTLIQTDDIIKTSNDTQSISTDSGALQIAGGVGIGRDLIVGGSVGVIGDVTVNGSVVSNTFFAIPDVLYISTSVVQTVNIIQSFNTVSSTSTTTGALQVAGGVGIGKELYVGGNLTVAGTSTTIPDTLNATPVYFTGVIAGSTLTVTGCPAGKISWGQYVQGSSVLDDTVVQYQLTGTSGGDGTYLVTNTQTITSTSMYVTSLFINGALKLAEGQGIYQQDEHNPSLYDLLIGISEAEATVHLGSINTNGVSLRNTQEYKIDSALNIGTYMAVASVNTGDNVILSSGNAASTQIRVGGDSAIGYGIKLINGGHAHIPAGVRVGTDNEYSVDSTLNPGTHLAVGTVNTSDSVILSDGNANTTEIKVGGLSANTYKYGLKIFNGIGDGQVHVPKVIRAGDNPNNGGFSAQVQASSIGPGSTGGFQAVTYNGTATVVAGDEWGSYIYGSRYRGTLAAPIAVKEDDWIMEFGAIAWDGVSQNGGGELAWRVDGAVSAGVNPSRAELYVTPQGSATQVLGLTIDSSLQVTTYGTFKTLVTTVSALPSASAVGAGSRAFVTDSTTVTSFLAIAVGGGVNGVPVVSNGTNWLIG